MKNILIFFTILICSCKWNRSGTIENNTSIDKSGAGQFCESNPSDTYVICKREIEEGKGLSYIEYFILDKSLADTIKRGIIDSGYLRWLDDKAVEIFVNPGNVSSELSKDDLIVIYLIDENKTISKTEYLNNKNFED